jgi:hypothetical protein
LRKIEDSVAHVAAGPIQKDIAGTSNSEFKQFVDHEESGIGGVLAEAIDNLNATTFNLPFSVSIAFPSIQDTPLIGISHGFLELSGYSREEIVGQNCRLLLKGVPEKEINKDVRQAARRYCKAAHLRNLTSMTHSLLLQRNARKNGELFWNLFMMAVLPGPSKRNYIVGLQLDLGPNLPEHEDMANLESKFFRDHRENLLMVQRSMFGNHPERAPGFGKKVLGSVNRNGEFEDLDIELELAEDIQQRLNSAARKCGLFQKQGTLPWLAWPSCPNHALMNAGACLLRLEADRVRTGAVAMSIFPVSHHKDIPNSRYFKIRVDDVCPIWGRDVHKGAILPTMGFTLMTPLQMDEAGGLPNDVGRVPESVMVMGDGHALCAAPDHEMGNDVVKQYAEKQGIPQFVYQIKNGDILECIWGKNWLQVQAEGQVIFEVRDDVIFPPSSEPAFAVFDLCGAVCRATLVQ